MKKAGLKELDTIRFPQNISLENLIKGDKVEYVYAARKVTSGLQPILEVDFFSLKENGIKFRVFFSENDFITQLMIPDIKWSESQLDKLDISCYRMNCVPLNKKTERCILSFFNKRIKKESVKLYGNSPIGILRTFQEQVRHGQLMKKHQKIKDRIDAEFVNMDNIPEDIYDWIEKYPLWFNQYVFYQRKGKKYAGYCSACKSQVFPEYAKHKLTGICPSCGSPITFKANGYSKNTSDRFVFSYLQKGINDSIIHRVFEGLKTYREGFDKPTVSFYECRRYIYRDNKAFAYHKGHFRQTNDFRWCEGYPSTFMGHYTFTDCGSLYAANLKDALKETKWRDCRIDKFAATKIPFDAADYLGLYVRQPEIQFLVENGLFSLVLEVINNWYSSRIQIEPKVFDILLEHKSFFHLFREIHITSSELELISLFRNKKFIKKDILLQIRKNKLVDDLAPVLRYTTPVKAINYLMKQSDTENSCKDYLIIWLDYLKLAEFLDYDMNSPFIIFPIKLEREHDRVNDEYGNVLHLKGNEKIALIADKVNSLYGYENKKFLIRAPRSGKEIKDEGSALRHCVGSYVKDMANLETFILFLREKPNINKPFFTVELRNNKVRQCRGYRNSSATPEIEKFLDEWQKELLKRNNMPKTAEEHIAA